MKRLFKTHEGNARVNAPQLMQHDSYILIFLQLKHYVIGNMQRETYKSDNEIILDVTLYITFLCVEKCFDD